MTPHENREQFARQHGIPLSEDEALADAEYCEILIGHIAPRMKNPSRENIQHVMYFADVTQFIDVLHTQYHETYIASPTCIQGKTASILLQPGYETEYHRVLQDGTVQAKKDPNIQDEVGTAIAERCRYFINLLEEQGPEMFNKARRNEGWKKTKTGKPLTFARILQSWEPYVRTLERIRIHDIEWLHKEEMPQALLDRNPEWDWAKAPAGRAR